MRVLFWAELYPPHRGGAEQLAARLARGLQERGHDLMVVTSHDTLDLADEEMLDGVAVRRFPFRAALRGGDAGAILETRLKLARLRRRFDPHLIHLFFVGPSAFFYLTDGGTRAMPSVLTLHGEVLRGGAGGSDSTLEKTMRAVTWITAVSQAVLQAARQMAPEIADRSSVLYSRLPAPEPTRAVRDSAVRDAEHPLFVCVGRLISDKGFDLAIRAFSTLAPSVPAARLAIAGVGPARAELETLRDTLGLRDRVEFLGWLESDQVPDLLSRATAVLIPSRREGLSLVAIQSAQLATPVIATTVGGLPEVVAHHETGLLIPPADPAALTDALSHLLQHPDEATRLGRNAQSRAEQLFGWNPYLDAMEALYREVVESADVFP